MPEIALLIPCYNEEAGIAAVVETFKKILPQASIYVYDNNSTDKTIENAEKAGAIVRVEPRQGKGHVVRRMFADIEADIYIMVDGDGTYDAASILTMLATLQENTLDMVIGTRHEVSKSVHRPGHKWGNHLFNKTLKLLFDSPFTDIFSGYRVFSRRFVKSFPALTTGFDIETEMSLYCLQLKLPTQEIPTPFFERAKGSESKLNTFRDGSAILWRIFFLFKEHKPFVFFGIIALFLMALSFGLGYPLITTFLLTGLVPKLPTAILSVGIMLLGFLSLTCGLILDSVSQGRLEGKRARYLTLKAPE